MDAGLGSMKMYDAETSSDGGSLQAKQTGPDIAGLIALRRPVTVREGAKLVGLKYAVLEQLINGYDVMTITVKGRRLIPLCELRPLAKRVEATIARLTSGPWLTLDAAAELIGVRVRELSRFVQGWLRDPVVGKKSRRGPDGVELFARENILKLKAFVQPKPQQRFTPAEAAKALAVPRKKVRQWMDVGLLHWDFEAHGKRVVWIPAGDPHFPGCNVPMRARTMESPCPSLCRPALYGKGV